MKSNFNLITLLLATLIFISCKNESQFTEYKYANNGISFDCQDENVNTNLYNEALLTFEKDIDTFYNKNKSALPLAYSRFTNNALNGRVKYEEIVSPHTIKVFEALKKDNSLWDANNPNSHLNYNSPLFKCIADNIKNKNLKTTLNSLISTNTMSPKFFVPAITSNFRAASSDKSLSAYIAFDLFYAKLFNVDLSKVNSDKEKLNKTQEKPVADTHAGHNH